MASPARIYLKAEGFVFFCLGATRTTRTPRAARAKGDLPYFTHCILGVELFSVFLLMRPYKYMDLSCTAYLTVILPNLACFKLSPSLLKCSIPEQVLCFVGTHGR